MPRPDNFRLQGYSEDKPFIFISYARLDKNIVYPEITRLQREGYEIWYDDQDIVTGRSWGPEIQEALQECTCFIVFITQHASESSHVREEIRVALALDKPFIRIDWEKAVPPTEFKGQVDKIHALKRYSLHKPDYEKRLQRALSDHVAPRPRISALNKNLDDVSVPQALGISPRVIHFILIILAVLFTFMTIVAVATPFLASPNRDDLLSSPLAGILTGSVFLFIAVALTIAAYMVHRKYLQRSNA